MNKKYEEYLQFPKDQCTFIDENIFIHKPKYEGSEYSLWFVVGVQYFQIGFGHETETAANWSAKMFKTALDKLRK